MIQLLILFDNKTLERMNGDKENYYQVIQTLEDFNSNIGIIKCLEMKKQTNYVPIGFEIIEADDDSFEILRCERFFFNGRIIDKTNAPKTNDWREIFKDFSDIKKYIYINENFCTPYIEETDNVININI